MTPRRSAPLAEAAPMRAVLPLRNELAAVMTMVRTRPANSRRPAPPLAGVLAELAPLRRQ